jgi:lantibiotic modifying enzyme
MIDDYSLTKILQALPETEISNINKANIQNNANLILKGDNSYDLNVERIIRNYITIINDSDVTYFSQQFNISNSLVKIIDIINPLLKKAEFEFIRFCEKNSFEIISHEVSCLILRDLARQAFNLLYKIVIHEANIYAREQKIKLNYETIDEYFQLLITPDYKIYILLKYPLILKDADRIINNWKKNNFELLSRVNKDYEILKESFNVKGKITHIDFAKGDSHLDGKTVCLLSFEENKIIYKPRNLKVEENFQT